MHSDVFRLLRAKGPVMCLPLLSNVLHTQSFATPCFTHRFVTHHLSHTTLSHALFHTQLSHTPSFTHSFVTPFFFVSHTIFHIPLCLPQLFTYNLFYFSIIHHILCLSFLPRPPTTFVDHYWKKLTCRVIRSFNFCSPSRTHPGLMGGLVAFPRTLKAQYELGCALVAH